MTQTDVARMGADERRALEAQLLRRMSRQRRFDELAPRQAGAEVPIAPTQRRLWFFHELMRGESLYQSYVCFRIGGPLDLAAMTAAVRAVVARHEVLRTTIATNAEGEPVQIVHEDGAPEVVVVDLTGLDPAAREDAATGRVAAELREPFDLTAQTPLRVRVLRLADDDHVLAIIMHHMVSDGRTQQILLTELQACYAAALRGETAPLAPLAVQYGDFAVWQDKQRHRPAWQATLDYWRDQLAGMPPTLNLPLDRPRSRRDGFAGGHVEIAIPPDVVDAVREVARGRGATLFMALLAGYYALLHRYTGDPVIPVGVPVSGRTLRKLDDLIGFFVNSLVVKADFGDEPTFAELVEQTRDTVLAGMDHQAVPFDAVVEALGTDRTLNHNPIFQTMFQLNDEAVTELELTGLTATRLFPAHGTSDFDLSVYLVHAEGGSVRGWFEYSVDLFDHDTVAHLADHFVAYLRILTRRPDVPVAELSFLTAADRERVLRVAAGAGQQPVPDRFFHEHVAVHAAANPDKVAVECGTDTVTYAELAARSDRLAALLRERGAGPEVVVAVVLEPSIDVVVTLLAVHKAGAAFLCVDPRYPVTWIDYVLADSGARFAVTTEALRELVGELPTVLLDDRPLPAPVELSRVDGRNVACVIYTGGSTGKPKGVVVTHANLANHAANGVAPLAVTAGDRLLQFASLSFDAAVEEIGMALSAGATLVVRDGEFDLAPSRFADQVRERGITVLSLPTSYWHELVDAGIAPAFADSALRVLAIGGEGAAPDRVRRWAREAGDRVRLLNGYAPCECTISSTWARLATDADQDVVTIGRPVTNCQVYVLDHHGEPVDVGMVGELHVAGAGLTRGYAGRPDLTAKAFRPNPFSGVPGSRLYRTGDLARLLPSGELVLLGRVDHQIKLRGYRIEPADIEITLRELGLVRDAVVRVREDVPGDRRLVAYVVAAEDADEQTCTTRLRTELSARLPAYMVPSAFVLMTRIPRTPSGKLDAARLPAPAAASVTSATAPADDLELRLLTLWRELLGAEVGVGDDFFTSGGHSLLAIQLVNRIEQELGRSIPVSALFPQATVARVAERLRADGAPVARSLLRLRGRTEDDSLLFVHPIGGDVLGYLPLARRLPEDLGLLALRAPALGEGNAHDELSAIAKDYLSIVDESELGRPTVFGGWSMGGVVAVEMARQVAQAGADAPPVVAIDSSFGHLGRFDVDGMVPEDVRLGFALDVARGLGVPVARLHTAREQGGDLLEALRAEIDRAGLLPAAADLAWFEQRFAVFARHLTASVCYRPRPYPGPVLLVLAEDRPDHDRVVADWTSVAGGGLTVHTVAADHYSIMADPLVEHVATLVGDWVSEVSPQ